MKCNSVCVFSSSSDEVGPGYLEAAEGLGREIARRNLTLVYGGSNLGLMGALARAAFKGGGKIVGIIPETLHRQVPRLDAEHELVVTSDLRHRKTLMEARSDAFIALPGGFGTLEELLEIIALKQLGFHSKPIAILNVRGFYTPLIDFFDQLFREKFVKSKHRELYRVCTDVGDVFSYLEKSGQLPNDNAGWSKAPI